MKTSIILLAAAIALVVTACSSTHDKGPYLPQSSKTPAHENTERVVLMDPGVQYSITCSGLQEGATADGRLEVSFDAPVSAVTPGQSVVLYEEDTVLGGGAITQVR